MPRLYDSVRENRTQNEPRMCRLSRTDRYLEVNAE